VLYLAAWRKKKNLIKFGSFDGDALREFDFSSGINSVQNSEAGNCLEWRAAGVSAEKISLTWVIGTQQQT